MHVMAGLCVVAVPATRYGPVLSGVGGMQPGSCAACGDNAILAGAKFAHPPQKNRMPPMPEVACVILSIASTCLASLTIWLHRKRAAAEEDQPHDQELKNSRISQGDSGPVDPAICRLIYDEKSAAITRQASVLGEIRATANGALALGALVTAAIMGLTPNADGLGECAWYVASLFAVSVFLIFDIWRPRRGWRLERNARLTIQFIRGLDEPQSETRVYEALACQLENDFQDNEKLLSHLQASFRALLIVVGGLISTVILGIGVRG